MQSSEILNWLRLWLAADIGPVRIHRLLERFGSPSEIFGASAAELASVNGIGEKSIRSLLADESQERAEVEFDKAMDAGYRILTFDHEDYPINLRELEYPPVVLYVCGDLQPQDQIALAVVGPRKPSDYARTMAETLIPPLCSRGITIVSGLAHGVDAEAHRAAVACGGRTLAVVAQGLDTAISPAANRKLATRIIESGQGAIISIFPLDTQPEPGLFSERNEIVAGLSLATLIPEAGVKSGSLITARHALDLNRPVMACPGDATRLGAKGSNQLIADGAILVQSSDDILKGMEQELRRARLSMGDFAAADQSEPSETRAATPSQQRRGPRDETEKLIHEILYVEHRTIDFIIQECAEAEIGQSAVIQKLPEMEMNGVVRQMPGRVYMLMPEN